MTYHKAFAGVLLAALGLIALLLPGVVLSVTAQQVTLSVEAYGELQAGSELLALKDVPIKLTVSGVPFPADLKTPFSLPVNPGTEVGLEAPAEFESEGQKLFFQGWKGYKDGPWVSLEKVYKRTMKQTEALVVIYSFRQEQPALPDLVITRLDQVTQNPAVGDTVSFLVKVENLGQAPAGAFDVELVSEKGAKDRKTVESLAINGVSNLSFQAQLGAEQEIFVVTIDPDGQVAESSKDNNRLQVTVKGQLPQPPTQPPTQPQPPTTPMGPEQLFWNFGDVNVSVSQVCIFGVCLNLGTIDATQPFPFDLSAAADRLGIKSAQQTQSTLPKDVTLTFDFQNKSAKLAGPAPSNSTGAQAMYDLFDGTGNKVATLTVTLNIILQGGTAPTPPTGPIPPSGPTHLITFRATLQSTGQNINGVPVSTNFGMVRTPAQVQIPSGASLTMTAPSAITISGVGTKTFQHWLQCVGVSCLAHSSRTLTITNVNADGEFRAVYGP
jgi:hypothetical protein